MLEQRLTCHDHRAVNNVNKHGGHLESTGIGATACIHGLLCLILLLTFKREKHEFLYLSAYSK